MADFKPGSSVVKWYNVLSFHFMQPEVKRPVTAKPTHLHVKQVEEEASKSLPDQLIILA